MVAAKEEGDAITTTTTTTASAGLASGRKEEKKGEPVAPATVGKKDEEATGVAEGHDAIIPTAAAGLASGRVEAKQEVRRPRPPLGRGGGRLPCRGGPCQDRPGLAVGPSQGVRPTQADRHRPLASRSKQPVLKVHLPLIV